MKTAVRSPELQNPANPATQWWQRLSPTVVGCVVAAAVAVWSTRGAWGGRPPAGEDVMGNLVRLDFGISHLVAHGRLDGWLPRFYLGYQEFLFNGPGLAWVVAAIRGATVGVLSNSGGIKIVGVASFAAVPVATAFLARSLGLGRLAAGIAAVLSLLVSNLFGVGLQALYSVGLVSHQLGAVFFCLALGALLRVAVDARRRWMLLAAVSLAALAVTHLISVLVLAVFFPLLAFGLQRGHVGREAFKRLALTALVSASLAAWWLVPALAHRGLRGQVATWATPPFGDRIDQIVNGRLLFRPYTVWLVVAGWVYGLVRVRQRRPFALVLLTLPLLYLVIAHWAASRWPDNEIALQLANRGLGYVGLLAVLPLAAGLAAAVRVAGRRLAGRPSAYPILAGTAFALAVGLVLSPLGPDRGTAEELAVPVPQLHRAAAELSRRVPLGARFVTQRDYPAEVVRTGVVQPATWLAHASGRNSLNGFNLESSSTPLAGLEPELSLGKRSAQTQAAVLERLGVSHVVTTTDTLAGELEAFDRFELVWREPPIAIFALRPRPGQPDPASLLATAAPAAAQVRRADPERVDIRVDASRATPATVAVAWSPKWRGRVDGRAVRLEPTSDGLIAVRLPAGTSTLELTYGPDGWDRVGVAISALTVAFLAVIAARRWRRRRRRQSTATAAASPRGA